LDRFDDHMPRTRIAMQAMEKALARLEGVTAKGTHGDLFLEQEVKALRADYARLDETAAEVEERLDGAILRIRSVLEG